MNKELVRKSLAYVKAIRKHPLSSGMELDYETIHALATKIQEKRDILILFAPNNGLPSSYQCGIKCDMCGEDSSATLTKTALIEYIEQIKRHSKGSAMLCYKYRPTCEPCVALRESRQAEESKKYSENNHKQYRIQRSNNTEHLMYRFLLPNAKPSASSSWKEIAVLMNNMLLNCHEEMVSKWILDMEYKKFLTTPYWKIIAYEVKRKHKFKCVMCDSKQHLNVHHKNYDFHGFEHTYEGMQSLTCVCEKCHSKHHGHYE